MTAHRLQGILQGDCIKLMSTMPEGSVDLAFADPPFNIGYEYDVYRDKKERQSYLDWSSDWIASVYRVLKSTGTFWLAIGDEYAAELKLISQEIGFHPRSWVIWYYTFGVNCKTKLTRSHAHLFYFVKDPTTFTFRADALENRIPSARQLVYADARANPLGRLPDDTWVLRPQDLSDCFTSAEDTWYLPRVAGTFKERAGFHGCQMPEQLLGRIVRLCSNEGELVFDPFSGSATTVTVAKKLGRRFLGLELSPEYVKRGCDRLDSACVGDPLDGAAEPTMSAPATPKSGSRRGRKTTIETDVPQLSSEQLNLFHRGLLKAYSESYDGYSLDRVVADPSLNARFVDACSKAGLPGEARTWNASLLGLRKAGKFADHPTVQRTEYAWEDCDAYLFASEIAWRQMIDSGCESLDMILADPTLASDFDRIAQQLSPGFTSLEYRWAALKLRKNAKTVRAQALLLANPRLSKPWDLSSATLRKMPTSSGIYVVLDSKQQPLYAGETNNVRERLKRHVDRKTKSHLPDYWTPSRVRFLATDCPYSTRLAHQWRLVINHSPPLNLPNQKIA